MEYLFGIVFLVFGYILGRWESRRIIEEYIKKSYNAGIRQGSVQTVRMLREQGLFNDSDSPKNDKSDSVTMGFDTSIKAHKDS